jgi:DnaJ family protein B protein 4
MDKSGDPYAILGIPYDATELDSKKEYRRLALKFHPDKQLTEEDRIAAHNIYAKIIWTPYQIQWNDMIGRNKMQVE